MRSLHIPERWRAVVVAISVAVLVVGAMTLAAYDEGQYRMQTTEAADVQARVLAETVTAAVSFGDRDALRDYVNALSINRQVDAAGVFDLQGKLMAGFTRSHLAPRLSAVEKHADAPDRVIVFAPIIQGGTRMGTVYLRDLSEPIGRRLSRYLGPGLLVLMATLMFAIMVFDAEALRRANHDLQTQIAEREKAETALRQSQKMEAIGRLTGGIAHDFNNMLAIVIGSLDLLLRRRGGDPERDARLAEQAMTGARRAAELTKRLLAFSRQQPLSPTSADVAASVRDTAVLLRRTLGEGVEIETVSAEGLWRAHIDLPQLETAIVNLAINARDAMPGGGKLTIEMSNVYLDRAYAERTQEVDPGQYVLVAVTDTGAGIPADLLDQVFDPFFTTKPVGSGTGLGLSQVHGFIRQSGGHVRIDSEVGVGTTVKLYLPRSSAAGETPDIKHGVTPPAGRQGVTVLVVEDEIGVRDFAVEALIELGYDVLAADGARMALRLIDQNPEIALLLTDVQMPETNGRALAEEVLKKRPSICVLFMTGYTRDAIVHNGVLDPDARLISKPFSITELGAEIASLLGARNAP